MGLLAFVAIVVPILGILCFMEWKKDQWLWWTGAAERKMAFEQLSTGGCQDADNHRVSVELLAIPRAAIEVSEITWVLERSYTWDDDRYFGEIVRLTDGLNAHWREGESQYLSRQLVLPEDNPGLIKAVSRDPVRLRVTLICDPGGEIIAYGDVVRSRHL
jgi:hypothetical protein